MLFNILMLLLSTTVTPFIQYMCTLPVKMKYCKIK